MASSKKKVGKTKAKKKPELKAKKTAAAKTKKQSQKKIAKKPAAAASKKQNKSKAAAKPEISWQIWVLVAVAVLAFFAVYSFPPIAQDYAYHNFADNRLCLNIPNFGNVLSNLPFAIFGIMGLIALHKNKLLKREEKFTWQVFFVGAALVAVGSAVYHLSPNNKSLVWDRLPMTVSFMALFTIVIAERINERIGYNFLPFLLALGLGSVLYWDHTESAGMGDLRPYVLVQFLPIAIIPLIFILFKARYTGTCYFLYTLGWYVLAKILEFMDWQIFTMTSGMISGHTLKHLAASMAILSLVQYITNRKPLKK